MSIERRKGNPDPFPDVTGEQPDPEMRFRPPRRGLNGQLLPPEETPTPARPSASER